MLPFSVRYSQALHAPKHQKHAAGHNCNTVQSTHVATTAPSKKASCIRDSNSSISSISMLEPVTMGMGCVAAFLVQNQDAGTTVKEGTCAEEERHTSSATVGMCSYVQIRPLSNKLVELCEVYRQEARRIELSCGSQEALQESAVVWDVHASYAKVLATDLGQAPTVESCPMHCCDTVLEAVCMVERAHVSPLAVHADRVYWVHDVTRTLHACVGAHANVEQTSAAWPQGG